MKNNNKKNGFTLIEVLAILFIFSIGIMAALSLAIKSSYFHNAKKDLVNSAFLANEGLELMINIRDTNIILGQYYDDWDLLGSVGISKNYYSVDYYSLIASSTTSIEQSVLQQDNTGFYLHNNDYNDSIFSRLITTKADSLASSSIESWVQWKNRDKVYNYKIETILYDLSF